MEMVRSCGCVMAGVCSRGLRLRMVARNRFSVTLTTTFAASYSHTLPPLTMTDMVSSYLAQISHFSAYWLD